MADFKKAILSCAVGAALGVGVTSANAVILDAVSWQLGDYNSDGLQSDFNFVTPPPGNSGNIFGSTGELCGGAACDPINMTGQAGQSTPNLFTTGFNFGGGGDFQPIVLDSYTSGATSGAINATIDTDLAALGDGQALQFSALDLAGIYQGVNTFLLSPDDLQNCTGEADGYGGVACGTAGAGNNPGPAFSTPFGYNVEVDDLGGGDYGVVVTYAGTIAGSGTTFDGNESNWRLEGIMSTGSASVVPVPAAVWLFGSGLMGLVGVARRRKAK